MTMQINSLLLLCIYFSTHFIRNEEFSVTRTKLRISRGLKTKDWMVMGWMDDGLLRLGKKLG